jgi:hypothetical protein
MWPEKKRRFNFLFRFFSTFSFDVLLLSKKREKRTDFFTQIFEKQEKKREKKRGGGGKNKIFLSKSKQPETDHFIASL